MIMLSITPVSDPPMPALADLVRESQREGFRFLGRMEEEWHSGANRFSKEGEALFVVFDDGALVAVGGINRESDGCGRLRRFYVKPTERTKGVGRLLAQHILAFASQHYARVVLRTDTAIGDGFYISLGFRRLPPGDSSTHGIELTHPDRSAERSN